MPPLRIMLTKDEDDAQAQEAVDQDLDSADKLAKKQQRSTRKGVTDKRNASARVTR